MNYCMYMSFQKIVQLTRLSPGMTRSKKVGRTFHHYCPLKKTGHKKRPQSRWIMKLWNPEKVRNHQRFATLQAATSRDPSDAYSRPGTRRIGHITRIAHGAGTARGSLLTCGSPRGWMVNKDIMPLFWSLCFLKSRWGKDLYYLQKYNLES